MAQKYRISTDIGVDKLITVELKQEYDILEILSLKFTQTNAYTSFCSDYGVVVGRVTANNGFGIPNAKVSIFIPLSDVDANDPVISALYPYTQIDDLDQNNYRYNLLPSRQQHGGHTPTGTFPDQSDILNREEILEVFEKYYKFTVKTNISGDFMIWGVPTGQQTLHIDVDTSDIGCFSLRPDDFSRQGAGVDKFKNSYTFKASEDLNSLPQIVTFNKTIQVYPFWGNTDFCQIGISRSDFDLSSAGVKIEPKAMVIGGIFTDTGKNAIDKNCIPTKNMGSKCTLASHKGKIEALRFTSQFDEYNRPIIEEYDLHEDIPEDGSFVFSVPMNMDYLYTNEFGEMEYTNNPNKGIPTSACYRFKFTMKDEGLERVRVRASYLVPNIREFQSIDGTEQEKSYAWTTEYSGYPTDAQDLILYGENGFFYPQDYFFRFHYAKVYTVSSFQSTLIHGSFLGSNRFLGIKEIHPPEDKDCLNSVVTPPINFASKNTGLNFPVIIADVVTFIQFIFSLIKLTIFEFFGSFLYTVGQALYNIYFGWPFNWRPFGRIGEQFKSGAYSIAAAGQFTLPLVIYDDCELCTNDDTSLTHGINVNNYCKIGELSFNVIYGVKNEFNGNEFANYALFYITGNTAGDSFENPGQPARDSDAGCLNSYNGFTGGTYTNMNSLTTTDLYGNIIPEIEMVFGGYNNSWLNSAEFGISGTSGNGNYQIQYLNGWGGTNLPAGYVILIPYSDLQNYLGISDITQYPSIQVNGPIESSYKQISGYTTYAALYDLAHTHSGATIYTGVTLEEGCAMYNRVYNKSIPKEVIWLEGETPYGLPTTPVNYSEITNSTQLLNNTKSPGIVELTITNTNNILADKSRLPNGGVDWIIGGECWYINNQHRLPQAINWDRLGKITYNRQTKTGFSEFRGGVFSIVPSIDGVSIYNINAIREWYRRKRVGIAFCGGIVNYSFIDNWLSGSLYFYQFKMKLKGAFAKFCNTIAHYSPSQNTFYYRSTVYTPPTTNYYPFTGGTWGYEGGSVGTNYVTLGHPTTFVDLGPRDVFIGEICTDSTLDPNCSVARSIGPTSWKQFSELVAFAINYRQDTTNDTQQVEDYFSENNAEGVFGGLNIFDGDIVQLLSINSEAGIDAFDMTSANYISYNIGQLDPVDEYFVFQNGTGSYGPVPITMQYDDKRNSSFGPKTRECLNQHLGETAQSVPYFLWDKKGTGFGSYTSPSSQSWDYANVHVAPLQGTPAVNFGVPNHITLDPYLLPPMSYNYSGYTVTGETSFAEEFDVVVLTSDPTYISDVDTLSEYVDTAFNQFKILIATSGTITDPLSGNLYIRLNGQWNPYTSGAAIPWTPQLAYSVWPTVDPYTSHKQILSTPFLYYFGLRPGNTAIDKLIERFGPISGFTTVN